jgi:type IV pilus assembly protein PilC
MSKFTFQARAANGKVQNGQIDAENESEARVKLRAKNLTPVRLSRVGGKAKINPNAKKKVSQKELQIFTRQFSTLVNAGIPIVDTLKILGEGRRGSPLKEAANKVRESIEGGKRLGESLALYPGIFDRLYVNMVHAGEEAGILDGILNRLALYMEKSQKIRNQVRGAMVYPMAILVVAGLVITGMLVFIIPKFQDMYSSAGKALPGLTQMVVNLSNLLIHKGHLVAGGLFAAGYLLYSYAQSPEGRGELDSFAIRFPIIGDVVQKSSLARMSRTLATLLSSGVSVVDALEIASRTAGNSVIEEALLRSKESVIAGRPLAAPLSKEPMIPEMVAQMISIGEKSGTMDAMFGKIADFYEDDVEAAVKAMTSMIEPVMMVFLGGAIAVLVLAMYLPIFDMANMASH